MDTVRPGVLENCLEGLPLWGAFSYITEAVSDFMILQNLGTLRWNEIVWED